MSNSNYKIETKCVQGGYRPGNGEPRQIPIVQSTTFRYETSEDMGKLFDLPSLTLPIAAITWYRRPPFTEEPTTCLP